MVYGDLNIVGSNKAYQRAKRIGDDQKINVYPFNIFETNYRHECDVRYFKNHKTKGVSNELINADELQKDVMRP